MVEGQKAELKARSNGGSDQDGNRREKGGAGVGGGERTILIWEIF